MSLQTVLTALADAIRSKSGHSGAMTLQQMTEAVSGIQQGGIDTSDATATAEDMAEGVTAYVNGEKITGSAYDITVGSVGLFYLSELMTINNNLRVSGRSDTNTGRNRLFRQGSIGRIFVPLNDLGDAAAEDVVAGKTFTSEAGLKVPGTMPMQEAKTITPGTTDQVIAAGAYLSGDQTIKGDANLVAGNIKSGVSIFGVDGALAESSGGIDTSDATATAADMANGVTAYANGEKVTGSVSTVDSGKEQNIWNCDFEFGTAQFGLRTQFSNPKLFRANSGILLMTPIGTFGDATAADVAAGKTFTSKAGLKLTGTHTCPEGLDTSDATAAAGDILAGKTAYVNGSKVTGTIQNKGAADLTASGASISVPAGYYASAVSKSVSTAAQAVPTISVGADGKITATTEQSAGYVESGTKSATQQLTTQAAQTITPGTADKTIASGKYLTGTQTIKGDANLIAGNIKSGVSIFGVAGTLAEASGNSIEAYQITSTSGTVSPKGSGTVKVWGYGLKSSGTYSNTMYAFVGDGYYQGSSYGSPSKTSATFGINSDGTISGLPSGLTALNVLVTIGI